MPKAKQQFIRIDLHLPHDEVDNPKKVAKYLKEVAKEVKRWNSKKLPAVDAYSLMNGIINVSLEDEK